MSNHVSRRHFIGGATAAAALSTMGINPQAAEARVRRATERGIRYLPGGAPTVSYTHLTLPTICSV